MGLLGFASSSMDAMGDAVDIVDLEDALEIGTTAATTGGAVAASSATAGATAILPIAGKILLEESVKDYMKSVGKKKGYEPLKKIAEERDDEEAARIGLSRACAGICKFADPLFDDENVETLVRSNPERLNTLIERVLTDEDAPSRDEFKRLGIRFSVIFLGEDPPENADIDINPENKDALIDDLKDIFDTEDRVEAVSLFMLYKQFLEDTTENIDRNSLSEEASKRLNIINDTVGHMQDQIEDFTNLYIETGVENQGFEILTLWDFERQETFEDVNRSPIEVWKTGFEFPELAERRDNGQPYYFERPLPSSHELQSKTTNAETITDALIERLRLNRRNNLALLGEPGMGKSHLCRRVATEWVDQGYGNVFYRTSDRSLTFDDTSELRRTIEQEQDSLDGHVLVVVEDATREQRGQRKIFDVINYFKNNPSINVSFLLDSRKGEWERYTNRNSEKIDPPYLFLAENNDKLEEYSVPGITESDCAAAIEVFNQTTKGYYHQSGEGLYNSVHVETTGRGELISVIDTLVRKGSFEENPPLASDASKVHEEIWKAVRNDEFNDETRLYYEIAVVSTLLTAAEIGVPASLLYGLADAPEDEDTIQGLLSGDIQIETNEGCSLPALNDMFLFTPKDDTEWFRTRHPTWALNFFIYRKEESLETRSYHRLIIDIVARMTGLADQEHKRNSIRTTLKNQSFDPTYLEQTDELTANRMGALLRELYEFSTREERIVWLFEAPRQKNKYGPEPTVFEEGIAVEAVPDTCPKYFTYELLLVYSETFIDFNSSVDKKREYREFLRELETQAKDTIDQPDSCPVTGQIQFALARAPNKDPTVGWDDVERYYREAISTYKEIDDLSAVASTQQALAEEARGELTVGWNDVEGYYREAINTYKEIDDLSAVASTQKSIAEKARWESTIGWNDVEGYYREAISTYKEIDNTSAVASTQQALAEAAKLDSTVSWGDVEGYYREAINTYKEIDDLSAVASTQQALAEASEEASAVEWDNIKKYHQAAINTYKEIDDLSAVASTQKAFAKASEEASAVEWDDVERHYQVAINSYKEINDLSAVASTQQALAEAAVKASVTEWDDVERYYQAAISIYREADDQRLVASAQANLAQTSRGSVSKWDDIKRYHKKAIHTARQVGNLEKVALIQHMLAIASEEASVTEWEEIERYYQAAIDTYKQVGDSSRVAKAHRRLSDAAWEASDVEWDDVKRYHEEAINARRETGDFSEVAWDHRHFAEAVAESSEIEWDEVKKYYEAAIDTFRENGYLVDVARTQLSLADAAKEASPVKWEEVKKYYQAAIDTYSETGVLGGVLSTQKAFAQAAGESSEVDWEDVRKHYQTAIDIHRQNGYSEGLARTQLSLADAAKEASPVKWEDVEKYYQAAIDTFRENGSLVDVARTQLSLSDAAGEASAVKWVDVEKYYQAAINTASDANDERLLGKIHCSLARTASVQDDLVWPEAREQVTDSLNEAYNSRPSTTSDVEDLLSEIIEDLETMVESASAAGDYDTAHQWINMISREVKYRGTENHQSKLEELRSILEQQ